MNKSTPGSNLQLTAWKAIISIATHFLSSSLGSHFLLFTREPSSLKPSSPSVWRLTDRSLFRPFPSEVSLNCDKPLKWYKICGIRNNMKFRIHVQFVWFFIGGGKTHKWRMYFLGNVVVFHVLFFIRFFFINITDLINNEDILYIALFGQNRSNFCETDTKFSARLINMRHSKMTQTNLLVHFHS